MSAKDDPNDLDKLERLTFTELKERFADSPNDVDLLTEIGKRYLGAGQFEQAEHFYRQALAEDEENPWTHLYLGNLYYAQNQNREALNWFSRACELLPDVACPYWCIADVYAAMGKADLAEANYKLAVKIQPDNHQAKRHLYEWYESRYTPD